MATSPSSRCRGVKSDSSPWTPAHVHLLGAGARQGRSPITVAAAGVEPAGGEGGDAASGDRTDDLALAFTVPGEPTYPGLYCDWSVTRDDQIEVWSYRACLSAVAVSCLVCSSSLVLGDAVDGAMQPAYFLGAGGLGAALFLIHMYVDVIKKAMQAMWAVGFAGSVGIALTTGESVPAYVVGRAAK